MNWFLRLTTNQRLAALAFVLGLVAIAAAPAREGKVSVLPQGLAVELGRSADRVSVTEAANWLIAGRADVRVIDLRDEAAYATYHIPSAENIPLASLPEAGLLRNEKVLVYGTDGAQSAQAWFLLKARGHRGVYLLDGGLEAWKSEVLFPRLGDAATPEAKQRNDALRSVSLHFGGSPLAAGSADQVPAIAPAPSMPVSPPASPAGSKPKPKKRKEGC